MADIEKKYREYFRAFAKLERIRHTATPEQIRRAGEKLQALRDEVEELIFSVKEPEVRNILRWRVLDGMTWERIARKKNQAKSWGHKILSDYFESIRKADA